MLAITHRRFARAIVFCAAIGNAASFAGAAVVAPITNQAGSSAVVTIGVTITTILGTSSDIDTKTVAVTGTGQAVFMPDAPPFASTQTNALNLNFANTTFTFQLFCIGPFCQTLNISVANLQMALTQPMCAPINTSTGAVAFSNAVFHVTGSYNTTGIATSSGVIDNIGPAEFSGRITSPAPGTVRFDQLAVADQSFVVPTDQLPAGVTALTLTFSANLANTIFNGPYAASANPFDADADGVFDACDPCTDTDGDGFGNPGFASNTCATDNCPTAANPSQADRDSDGVGNACDCLADISPSATGGDGVVNVSDLLLVIGSWGACVNPANCPADAAPITPTTVGDGVVDVTDLLLIIGAWGSCP